MKKFIKILCVLFIFSSTTAKADVPIYLKCTKLVNDNSFTRNPKEPEQQVVQIVSNEKSEFGNPIYKKTFSLWNAKISVDTVEDTLFVTIKPQKSDTESSMSFSLNKNSHIPNVFLYVTYVGDTAKKQSITLMCEASN